MYHIYYQNIINYIKPKGVITYIVNNSIYLWLSQKYKKCEFIAIQNGLRQNFENYNYKDICKHQHFYCFGMYDVKKHKTLGCSIKYSYPVGSFRAGLINNDQSHIKKEYDICIISSDGRRDPKIIKEKGIQEIAHNNRRIDQLLKKYIKDHKLSLVIALSTNNINEKEYFNNLFGHEVSLMPRTNELSTYHTVNKSKLSISFMSTMILETIALGSKAISIHFDNSDIYFDYPKEIKYLYKDYNSFCKYMNRLLSMSQEEYIEKIEITKELVMNNDINNPPHQLIKKHVQDIVNSAI